MKKVILSLFIAIVLCAVCGYVYLMPKYTKADTIYLNANDDVSFENLRKLAKALNNEGYRTVLSHKDNFKSGLFNLYAANNNQLGNLPIVVDSKAINLLWLPNIIENKPETLRAYDVIVVKSFASFSHLKAVNMRAAYIPDAIDIEAYNADTPNGKVMYYGDKTDFSLAQHLANIAHLNFDTFGKGYTDALKETPKNKDFASYSLVLVDQSDEEIALEQINRRILTILRAGGLPYVRYNSGIAKIFRNTLLMYANEQEFLSKARMFLSNPSLVKERRAALYDIAKQWNTQSQAQKIAELFEVMKRKMK
jgi:hypothetical protein